MPTYVYEIVKPDGTGGDRFEVLQRISEPPLAAHPETGEPVRRVITGFAIASTVARCIGIIRWLVPVPVLAELYAASTDEAERTAISVTFEALNSFGGTIGEVLGVSIFAAISIGLFAIAALKTRALPLWIGAFGLVAALAVLATAVELLGMDASSLIFLGTTVVQVWFLATGIWLLVRGGRPSTSTLGS